MVIGWADGIDREIRFAGAGAVDTTVCEVDGPRDDTVDDRI